ncbi:MAG: anti-sigma factor family protein [Candidatus Saccharicenans sp.]
MSCPKVSEIYAYLEHELPVERQTKIEEHLKSCPRCQRLLADRQAYLEAMADLPDSELPPDFTEKVMSNLPGFWPSPRILLFFCGGLYLLFSVLIGILAVGSKSRLFPICLEIFKNLYNLAAELSSLIFKAAQQIHGFIKAVVIFLGVIGKLLLDLIPDQRLIIAGLLFGVFLTMALLWLLIKPLKIINRS